MEAAELRRSRTRLVLATDAERRALERELHDGVQQQLVELAVNLQVARDLVGRDPGAAGALLDETARDVRATLDAAAELAQRIYPPLLETGTLAAALRTAAMAAGVRASVDVAAARSYPAEVTATVYFCWLAAVERAGAGARATVTVGDGVDSLTFDIDAAGGGELDVLRDRVEALGGRLTIQATAGGARLSGSLPAAR